MSPGSSRWRELPVLLLRGTRDTSTDMDETLALRKLFGAAGSELTELSGAGKRSLEHMHSHTHVHAHAHNFPRPQCCGRPHARTCGFRGAGSNALVSHSRDAALVIDHFVRARERAAAAPPPTAAEVSLEEV